MRFTRVFLRADPWPVQEQVLQSVATSQTPTFVKACHASGKSFVGACAVLWWLVRYPDGIVITTAPTWTQVRRILWGEINRATHRGRIRFPTVHTTALEHNAENYAIGISTNEGVRFQGFHGRVLIVVDEAPGVKGDIWEAIEGIAAGGDVRILGLGNPIIPSGHFYDAFTKHRKLYNTITISAFDTPNFAGLRTDPQEPWKQTLARLLACSDEQLAEAQRPYLTTRRWVKDKWHKWGEGHPLWDAKVLGDFPTQADNALISLAWLEAARRRKPILGKRPRGGLDVAGPGEAETVLALRDGPTLTALYRWAQRDPRGEVVQTLRPLKQRLEVLKVDAVGIGYYMARHLEDAGFPVFDVNVGEASSDPEKYKNLKAELYWGLRQCFQDGDVIFAETIDPEDLEEAIGQLAGILYEHNARGQIEIESKEDAMEERGADSPDIAEAVMLCYGKGGQTWKMLDLSSPDEVAPGADARKKSPNAMTQQIRDRLPEHFEKPDDGETCGGCANFIVRAGKGFCRARYILVDAPDRGCDLFQEAMDEGDDDDE